MYIAIDAGGSKTLVAVFSENGEIITSEKIKTPKDYDNFIKETVELTKKLMPEKVKSIAVAVPGHIEDDDGLVKGFGNLDWKNKDIRGDLAKHFEQPVVIDNDANMGALGEANMGAGNNARKVLYVTISTGIGTGITVEGKISPALKESEGGFMVFEHEGKLMPWEKFASGKSFYKEYHKLGAEVDDPKIWKEFVEDITLGLINLISLIQPDIIIIGGSMGVHFHKYGEFLNDAIKKYSLPTVDTPQVVAAKDPENAVINGCYVAAMQYAKDN